MHREASATACSAQQAGASLSKQPRYLRFFVRRGILRTIPAHCSVLGASATVQIVFWVTSSTAFTSAASCKRKCARCELGQCPAGKCGTQNHTRSAAADTCAFTMSLPLQRSRPDEGYSLWLPLHLESGGNRCRKSSGVALNWCTVSNFRPPSTNTTIDTPKDRSCNRRPGKWPPLYKHGHADWRHS